LVALAADTPENAKLLEDHGPGNDGENREQEQNSAGNPARLSKDITEISDEKRGEQKNDPTPQLEIKTTRLQERSTRLQGGQTNEMRGSGRVLPFWIHEELGR
jgi:hypothetical protein